MTSVAAVFRHGRIYSGHPRLGQRLKTKDVDARDKPGHDGIREERVQARSCAPGRDDAWAFSLYVPAFTWAVACAISTSIWARSCGSVSATFLAARSRITLWTTSLSPGCSKSAAITSLA